MTLITVMPGYANNGMSCKNDRIVNSIGEGTVSLSSIFFEDNESKLLFIDFEAIGDGIARLNILKEQN